MCERPALCVAAECFLRLEHLHDSHASACMLCCNCGTMPNSGVCSTLHEYISDQHFCLQDAGKVLAAEYGVPLEFIDVKTKKG